jgi:hypothetical protein
MLAMAKIEIFIARARLVRDEDGLKFVRKVLLEMRTEARALATGPYATGALERSIRISGPRVVGDNIEGSVGTRKKYAMAVEEGARPHRIVPRRARALAFFWRKVGLFVVLSQVRHPGQKGKHYLLTALEHGAARNRMKLSGGGI